MAAADALRGSCSCSPGARLPLRRFPGSLQRLFSRLPPPLASSGCKRPSDERGHCSAGPACFVGAFPLPPTQEAGGKKGRGARLLGRGRAGLGGTAGAGSLSPVRCLLSMRRGPGPAAPSPHNTQGHGQAPAGGGGSFAPQTPPPQGPRGRPMNEKRREPMRRPVAETQTRLRALVGAARSQWEAALAPSLPHSLTERRARLLRLLRPRAGGRGPRARLRRLVRAGAAPLAPGLGALRRLPRRWHWLLPPSPGRGLLFTPPSYTPPFLLPSTSWLFSPSVFRVTRWERV